MENVDLMQLLLSPAGRVNRAKWWGTWFGTWAAWILVFVFAGVVRRDLVWMLAAAIFVLFLWGRVVVTIKRWHDLDKSGWWVLIALIPVIGEIWTVVSCGFAIGSDGENTYGPDPLAPVRS
jgi:uncharacterized membrane protein YhaH (DUF805 family)